MILKYVFLLSLLFTIYTNIYSRSFTTSRAVFTRFISKEWDTICIPFEYINHADDKFSLYMLKAVFNDVVVLEQYPIGSIIDAGTPCIIHCMDNFELKIVQDSVDICFDTNCRCCYGDWVVRGTYSSISLESDCVYCIKDNKLLKNKVPFPIAPFSAWFEYYNKSMTSNDSYDISICDDEFTFNNIVNILNEKNKNIYNIKGYRVNEFHKGINIVVIENVCKKIYVK